jgi:hypothetical protein
MSGGRRGLLFACNDSRADHGYENYEISVHAKKYRRITARSIQAEIKRRQNSSTMHDQSWLLGGLPRKIGLAKDSEPLAGQDRPPTFLIIEMECHS